MEGIKCRSCGTLNRQGAKFCQKCGSALTISKSEPSPSKPNKGLVGKMVSLSKDFLQQVDEELDDLFSGDTPAAGQPASSAQNAKEVQSSAVKPVAQPASSTATPPGPPPGGSRTIPTQSAAARAQNQAIPQKIPGERIAGYVIQKAWPLLRSNYYKVCLARCPQGHVNPSTVAERCNTCESELQVFLMHETVPTPAFNSDSIRQALLELSRRQLPGILRHASVLSYLDRQYVIVDYPGEPWISLGQVNLPLPDPKRVVAWCMSIGQTLSTLYEHNLIPETAVPVDCLEPLVLLSNDQPCFADLGIFNPRSPAPIQQGTQGEQPGSIRLADKEIIFLGQILYMLSSGNRHSLLQAPPELPEVSETFRRILNQVRHEEFNSLPRFLDALRQTLAPKESYRSLRQIPSHRTDLGRVRDHNEDFVGKWSLGMQQSPDDPEVGLYLVADGMGGHQAGELASRSVVQVMLDEIQQKAQDLQNVPKLKRSTIKLDQVTTPGEVLKQAVLRANEVLYNSRKSLSSDRGTTLTAALVVGDVCAVANVGDSRTYQLHQGQLQQISTDHSLVASLVSANLLRPEEVRSHPQRNQIFRTLGDKLALDVDIFERNLSTGDRLLLCSDGLWEMVLDNEIERILNQTPNPAAACDRLIEAANQAGGQDNIGVVVVWLE
jgi:serine/threonine protein phosphatase PrpC